MVKWSPIRLLIKILICPNIKTKFGYIPEKHANGCGANGWKGVMLKFIKIPPNNPMWFLNKGNGYYAQAGYSIVEGNFLLACNKHDTCYGTCSSDSAKKSQCDDSFRIDMLTVCDNDYVKKEGVSGEFANICIKLANMYYSVG